MKKDNRLEKLISCFINDYQFSPAFGIEIEFYLSKNIDSTLFAENFPYSLKAEKGDHQFEIDLSPSHKLTEYASHISDVQVHLQKVAASLGGQINLKSKPFPNDYGSSMHFNLSFTEDSKILEHGAKSLCHFMLDSFLVFMPYIDDYLRLDERFMAPTHISYGGNNRTTAIRIPSNYPLRLEHRISSCLSDPYLVMVTILTSILKGLKFPATMADFPKIYGNAFDDQYNLTPLPKDIDQAFKLFKPEFFDYPF